MITFNQKPLKNVLALRMPTQSQTLVIHLYLLVKVGLLVFNGSILRFRIIISRYEFPNNIKTIMKNINWLQIQVMLRSLSL